jgi:hypothetical protein
MTENKIIFVLPIEANTLILILPELQRLTVLLIALKLVLKDEVKPIVASDVMSATNTNELKKAQKAATLFCLSKTY